MATIAQLMIIAERELNEAHDRAHARTTDTTTQIENEIAISQAASLLAIARSLNHIIDHGIGPLPFQMRGAGEKILPVLKIDEEKSAKKNE